MTIQFLDQLKVKISDTTINDALQYHPDYPSLLSVSDVLHQWNVANLVVQVEHSKLAELPTPFIAHFKSSMGDQFRLITSVDENSVKYSHTKNKWEIVTEDNFQKEWSGIVLLAEADNDNKEKNYDNILEKERIESLLPIIFISIGLIFSGLGMLMIFMQFEKIATLEFSWAFLLLLKYTGLLVSIFLLWAEIDQSNSIIKKVCGEGKRKVIARLFCNRREPTFSLD